MPGGQFLETLLENMGDAVISWTVSGEIVTWNKAAEQLLGYRRGEVIGRNVALLVPRDRLHEHEQLIQQVLQNGGSMELITLRLRIDGEPLPVSLVLSRLDDPEGKVMGLGCVLRSHLQTAQLIDHLLSRAHTDALTGVLNRAGIEERLAAGRALDATSHHAIMFIDLDGFKQVNDEAGHRQGDQLLRQCARRIRAHLDDDHLLARWGGDEFVVLHENLSNAPLAARLATESFCGRLLDVLRPAYELGERRYSCPASIGACCYRPLEIQGSDALEIADLAMYQAKAGGKNAFRVATAPRRGFNLPLNPSAAAG